ncbi:methyltransferase [Mesorhizobium sangaii]|uniref:Methylase of polypeptide subunit release factors n=1 Tax=Mesorhizobium sangaii TaxID=505389 RepID=A0A841PEV7_9HYPH|nr:methyltransferase [Mesorhizobium sangaii]MBB6413737.1 methylase of polypeptide subunit release factors [Mesorhizobium sangaii]
MTYLNKVIDRLKAGQLRKFPLHINELGLELVVNRGVFLPQDFQGWRWYAENFPAVAGKNVLEIGCGFGLPGLYLAKLGAASLVSCDIDPKAVANTLENAERNGITNVEVIESDVFSNIPSDRRFDFIYWYFPSVFAPGDYKYKNEIERVAIDPGYKLLSRFLSEGPEFLETSGSIVLGIGNDARDDLLEEIIVANNLSSILLGSGTYAGVSGACRMFSIRKRTLDV